MPLNERVKRARQTQDEKKKRYNQATQPKQTTQSSASKPIQSAASNRGTPGQMGQGNQVAQIRKMATERAAIPKVKSGPLNYTTKDHTKWTAPEFAAYGSATGNDSVFSVLESSSNDRGSPFFNPYRGGMSTIPKQGQDILRNYLGYDGPFDQQFVDTYNPILGDKVIISDTLSTTKPGKKSTAEQQAAWWFYQIKTNLKENEELNNEYADYRSKLNDSFDQFKQLYGRAPTEQEFLNSVDRSKYSYLTGIDDSLRNTEKKVRLLPTGTYYSPEILTGLYYAKLNGEDITIDRDYFLDAKEYAMSPIQASPSVQKYAWSDDDLSALTPEEQDKKLTYLRANGANEEAEAFRHAVWASQPDRPEGISTEPSILESAIGFYKDEDWFNRAHEILGSEYTKRLLKDGSVKNPGNKGDLYDQAAYELYKAEQTREDTFEVENAFNELKNQIATLRQSHSNYPYKDVSEFREDVLRAVDIDFLNKYEKALNSDNFYSKYCREMPVTQANLDAVINRAYNFEDVTQNIDYSIIDQQDSDGDKPAEKPMFYAEQQKQEADNRIAQRNNAEKQAVEGVTALADSGVPISKGEMEVYPGIKVTTPAKPVQAQSSFNEASILDDQGGLREWFFDAVGGKTKVMGWMAKLWHDDRKEQLTEKLGPDYTIQQAAAVDPVLNQLDVDNMPDAITGADVIQLATSQNLAKAGGEDICLADGIIGAVLPGIEYLSNIAFSTKYTFDQVKQMTSAAFDSVAYKNVYNDRVANGYAEQDAAEIAYFAATNIASAVRLIGASYDIYKDLQGAAIQLISDISKEEGAKDTYEVIKTINDDVADTVFADDSTYAPEQADLTDLNVALMVGSSESADPGFKATTNQIMHDISVGDITSDDIIAGLGAFKPFSDVEIAASKITPEYAQSFLADQQSANQKPYEAIKTNLGTTLTFDEYKTVVLGEAKDIMSQPGSLDVNNLSDELKVAIDYPAIEEMSRSIYGDDPNMLEMMTEEAIDSLINPDKKYNTNPLLENSTDFLFDLHIIGMLNSRDETKLQENASKAAGNVFQRVLQMSADADRFDILPTLFALTLGEDENDLGKLSDLFMVYGKWFSRNEIDESFAALASGKATFDEIEPLIMERVSPLSKKYVDERYISAISNPNALNQSFAEFDNGISRLIDIYSNAPDSVRASRLLASGESLDTLREQYPDIALGLDLPSLRDAYMTPEGLYDDEAFYNAANEKLRSGNEREGLYDFDENQLNGLGDLVSFIKQCGASGYILSYLDNDTLKRLSNGAVDLDAAGLGDYNAGQLMSIINPNWGKPYGINPGSDDSLLYSVVGGGISGTRKVASIPSYLMRLFAKVSEDTPLEGAMSSKTRDWANKSYDALKRIETKEAGLDQHVATRAEAFVRQGVSEAVRNILSSAIGGKLAGYYADNVIESLAGMPVSEAYKGRSAIQALETITENLGAKQYAVTIAKQLGRLPMYAGVFGREANDELDKDSSKAKALIKGGLLAAIESVTEDLGLEKAASIRINGIDLAEHALNSANNLGGLGAYFVLNSARNVISEIGEEEAAEVLGRFVDMGEMMIQGEGAESAFWKSMEGLPEAAANTAVATAFSTLLFSAYDLGNLTYNYLNDCMINGTEPNPRTVVRNVEVDITTNMDENQEAESKPEEQTQAAEEQTESTPETSADDQAETQAEIERMDRHHQAFLDSGGDPYVYAELIDSEEKPATAEIASEPSVDESIEEELGSESTQKVERPTIEPQQKAAPAPAIPQPVGAFNPANDVPSFERKVVNATKEAAKNPTEESIAAFKQAMKEYDEALTNAKAVQVEEAMAPAAETEETQEQEQQAPNLTTGAQTVLNYMQQSQGAIDNAVINKAGEIAAIEAVELDPGLDAKSKALTALKSKTTRVMNKVAKLQDEGQRLVGQLNLMFGAAFDEGINPEINSPQIMDPKWSLQEKQGKNAAETAKEQENLNVLQEQVKADEQALEEEENKVKEEAKNQAVTKHRQKLEESRKVVEEAAAQKRIKNPEAEKKAHDRREDRRQYVNNLRTGIQPLDSETAAEEADKPNDQKTKREFKPFSEYSHNQQASVIKAEDEAILNQQKFERKGADVHSLFANDDYDRNREQMAADNEANADIQVDQYKQGIYDTEAVERSVDPGNYKTKPLVEQRREDEWKDERKQNEDVIIRDQERQARMLGDFLNTLRNTGTSKPIRVTREIYEKIDAGVKRIFGQSDSRYAFSTNGSGDAAKTTGMMKVMYPDIRAFTLVPNAEAADNSTALPSEIEYYDASKFLDEDGGVSALTYDILSAADPNFATATLRTSPRLFGTTAGVTDNRLEHVTENGQYIILKQKKNNNTKYDEIRKVVDGLTTKGIDGKTGLERGQERVDEAQAKVNSFTGRVNQLTARLDDAAAAMDAAADPKERTAASKEYKSLYDQLKLSQRSLNIYEDQLEKLQRKQSSDEQRVFLFADFDFNDSVFYIIDKSKLADRNPAETYQKAVQAASERFAKADGISEGGYRSLIIDHYRNKGYNDTEYAEALDNIINKKLDGMTDDELSIAYRDILIRDELSRLSNEEYQDAVTVVRDNDDELANDYINDFVNEHGGYSPDGGHGFASFKNRTYYNQNTAFFATEEAIFKTLPQEEAEKLTKTTKAQYNNKMATAVRSFANRKGLNNEEARYLIDSFSTKAVSDRQIGNATVVVGDQTHLLGIPTGKVDDYDSNHYLRDDNGDFSIEVAKQRLDDQIDWMMEQANKEDRGETTSSGTPIKLTTNFDSIQVYWYDAAGVSHSRKVGEFYTDKDGNTKRYFPPTDKLLDQAYKIVCNFPVVHGKTNKSKDSMVWFTLFQDDVNDSLGAFGEARGALQSADAQQVESELGYKRPKHELVDELYDFKKLLTKLTGVELPESDSLTLGDYIRDILRAPDPNGSVKSILNKALNVEFDFTKKDVVDLLEKSRRATGEQLDRIKAKIKTRMDTLGKLESAINSINQRLNPTPQSSAGNKYDRTAAQSAKDLESFEKQRHADYNVDISSALGPNPPKWSAAQYQTARGRYDYVKAQYDSMTGREDDPVIARQRDMLAKLLPTLKQYADEEDAQNEAATEPIQPASPKPESDIPAQLEDLKPLDRLAVIQNLADSGENVEAARSEAIQEYHDQKMEGMSDQERIDYLAEQAERADKNPDSPLVDPNVDYDQQLGDALMEQAKKQDKKTSKRLRSIAKNAANYKSLRGINNAMTELDQMEKDGLDVTEAREALNKRREALSNPEAARQQAVIDSIEDNNFKIDLQAHAARTVEDVIDDVRDEMSTSIEGLLDDMARPPRNPKVTTGFEDVVNSVRTADEYLPTQADAEEQRITLANMVARKRSLKEYIDMLSESISSATAENEKLQKKIHAFQKEHKIAFKKFSDGAKYEKFAQRLMDIARQNTENQQDKNDEIIAESLNKDFAELYSQMRDFENANGFELSDEDRLKYSKMLIDSKHLRNDIMENKKRKDDTVAERQQLNKDLSIESAAFLRSSTAQQIARNATTFNLAEMVGDDSKERYFDKRRTSIGMAHDLMRNLKKKFTVGYKTLFTPLQLQEAMIENDIINDEELDYNHDVVTALKDQLKEQQIMTQLLDLGKSYAQFQNDKITDDEYNKKLEEVKDNLYSMLYMRSYDDEWLNKRDKHKENMDNTIAEWLVNVESMLRDNDYSAVYTELDNQYQIISTNINRAEQIVSDYFSLSSSHAIAQSLDGSYGGHLANQLLRLTTGLVMNGMDKEYVKKGTTKHPIKIAIDTMDRINEAFLGDGASVFNSIVTAPVRAANGKIAKEKAEIIKQLNTVKLKNKTEREALSRILNDGWDSAQIISEYGPEVGKRLAEAAVVHSQVYDRLLDELNVVKSRNGLEVIKRRSSYFSHIRMEQNAILRALGINTNLDEISTGMLGHTEDTVPTHNFGSFELERSEDTLEGMDLDAERVMNTYLDFALRAIHQTDNLIRLNDVIGALGGNRKQTGNVDVDYAPSILDYTSMGTLDNKGLYNTYVRALETYRDMVAGKKTGKLDRAVEELAGRKVFGIVGGLTKLQGLAKVGLNLSPVVANFIPVFTSAAIHPQTSMKASFNTFMNMFNRMTGGDIDPTLAMSNFYASRVLNERAPKTKFDAVTNKLFTFMSATDALSSEIVWRTYYYSFMDKLGPGNEKQAAMMADKAATDTMASKDIGQKGKAYNSTTGSILLQFTQEAVNNLSFLKNDLLAYSGGYNGKRFSYAAGAAKALASLLTMFGAGYYMNKFTGRDVALDPIGSYQKAKLAQGDNNVMGETIVKAASNFLETLNPVENITEGGIFDAPVPSAIIDTGNAAVSTITGAGQSLLNYLRGDEVSLDWTDDLAKALWNWVPGSAALNRVADTVKSAKQGYATSAGTYKEDPSMHKIKFEFDPTPGNIAKAAAFGVNSIDAAQEYNAKGYQAMPYSEASDTIRRSELTGEPFWKAHKNLLASKKAEQTLQSSNLAKGFDQNYLTEKHEAEAIRQEAGMPSNISSYITSNDMYTPWIQKGLDIWRKTGKNILPEEITTQTGTVNGVELNYIKHNGKNVPVSQQDLDDINQSYIRTCSMIYDLTSDPDEIEKRMKKARNSILDRYYEANYGGGK